MQVVNLCMLLQSGDFITSAGPPSGPQTGNLNSMPKEPALLPCRQKIDEPPTPFVHSPASFSDDEALR